jgi:hypothetical protein
MIRRREIAICLMIDSINMEGMTILMLSELFFLSDSLYSNRPAGHLIVTMTEIHTHDLHIICACIKSENGNVVSCPSSSLCAIFMISNDFHRFCKKPHKYPKN